MHVLVHYDQWPSRGNVKLLLGLVTRAPARYRYLPDSRIAGLCRTFHRERLLLGQYLGDVCIFGSKVVFISSQYGSQSHYSTAIIYKVCGLFLTTLFVRIYSQP
jgi:hypothetical protein